MKFLSNIKLSHMFVIVAIVPIFTIAVLSTQVVVKEIRKSQAVGDLEQLTTLTIRIGDLIHEQQIERGASAGYVGSSGTIFAPTLASARQQTDIKSRKLKSFLSEYQLNRSHWGEYEKTFNRLFLDIIISFEKMDAVRKQVDTLSISAGEAIDYYSNLNQQFLRLIDYMGDLSADRMIVTRISAYSRLLRAKEQAGIERAFGANAITTGKFSHEEKVEFMRLIMNQKTLFKALLDQVTDEQRTSFNKIESSPAAKEVQHMRDVIIADGQKENLRGINAEHWFATITNKINGLKTIEDLLARDLLTDLARLKAEVSASKWWTVAMVLFALSLTVGLSYLFIRTINSSFRSIATAMTELANGNKDIELPSAMTNEIGSMVLACKVFHQNAIALEQNQKALVKARKDVDLAMTRLLAFDEHSIIAVTDTKGTITYANEKFCEISKYDYDELVGSNHRIVNSDHHPKSFFTEMYRTIANGKSWHGEIKNKAKDGSHYWVDTSIQPIRGDNGKISHYIAIRNEITVGKVAEAKLRKHVNILNTTFENFPGGISLISKDLTLQAANPAFYKLLDLPKEQFGVGTTYESIMYYNAKRGEYGEGDIGELVRQRVKEAKKFKKLSFKKIRPGGTILEIRGWPLPEGGFIASYMDISDTENMMVELERKSNEAVLMSEDLRQAQDIQMDAIDNISEGFVLWDENDKLIMCNSKFKTFFPGMEDKIQPNLRYRDFARQAYENGVFELNGETLERAIEKRNKRLRMLPALFEEKLVNERWVKINMRRASNNRIVGIITDISRQKESEFAIKQLAETDNLTGLPNRAVFHERLQSALKNSGRTGSNVGVMILDLDHFKVINDSFGHPFGDALLCEVANRLVKCVRETDTVARLGGDEFAIVTTNLKTTQDIEFLAYKICASLGQPYHLEGRTVFSLASIGITIYPHDDGDSDQLLRNADIALYKAKDAGRGQCKMFDSKMDEEMLRRRIIEQDLRQAMEEDRLELYYQPQVDISSGQIIGAEALLRWKHDERGMVQPSEFIPIAEATGLIQPLGEWVVNTACRQAIKWQNHGLAPIPVAVNISSLQFKYQKLANIVEDALKQTQLDPRWLELEITETIAMDAASSIQFEKLKKLGVKMAIDDFGTGYSSLSQLRDFPVNRLKIDKSFVKSIETDSAHREICSAIINLGKSLKLQVIGEGVETLDELEVLKELGCNEIQGYLCAPALPASAFTKFLSAHDPKSISGEYANTEIEQIVKTAS